MRSVLHLCGIISIVSVVYCKRIAQLWMRRKLGSLGVAGRPLSLLAACPHKFSLGYFKTQSRVASFLDRCLVFHDRPKASLCAHMCGIALAEAAGVGAQGQTVTPAPK